MPNEITLRAKELLHNRPAGRSFASAYAEALASLLNESAWPESSVPHQWEHNRSGSNFKDWTLTNETIGPWNRTALPKDRMRLHKNGSMEHNKTRMLLRMERLRNRSAALKNKTILKHKPGLRAALLKEMVLRLMPARP